MIPRKCSFKNFGVEIGMEWEIGRNSKIKWAKGYINFLFTQEQYKTCERRWIIICKKKKERKDLSKGMRCMYT